LEASPFGSKPFWKQALLEARKLASMSNLLIFAIFLGAYVVLMRWVLPSLGVPT
jgi:hypothetical protein